jgi:DME family drug/metabolite transporter
VSKELADARLAAVIYGTAAFFGFCGISLVVSGAPVFSLYVSGAAFLGGIGYCLGIFMYYNALEREEVSKSVPIFSTIPIFLLIMAYFLLGETLTTQKYIGIFVIVAGAVLISLKGYTFHLRSAFWIALAGAFFYALADIGVKYATFSVNVWQMLFWVGCGAGLFALVTFAIHHPHIRAKARAGTRHLAFSNGITIIGDIMFFIGISFASVSLVSALAKVQNVFIFIMATALSLYHPEFIHEKINAHHIIKKTIAIALILAGSYLII